VKDGEENGTHPGMTLAQSNAPLKNICAASATTDQSIYAGAAPRSDNILPLRTTIFPGAKVITPGAQLPLHRPHPRPPPRI